MEKTNVETLFEWIDETTEMIQQHLNEFYLDSLAISLDCLFQKSPGEELDETLTKKIEKSLQTINLDSYKVEEIRKAVQLAILKGMKGPTQEQHLMTPETVALLVGYLAHKITEKKDSVRVFDPACGTANLLTAVANQLGKPANVFGSEVDPTLIKLSLLNANLQKINIEFFHQDSLRPFLLDPVDLIVADLPVGYYPDDFRASDFALKANEGHSYAHHLFIEQSLNYTVEGGYLIFIIPNFLFESDQAAKLNGFLHENAHIIGLLTLPESAFKSEKNGKSILILQKKGQHTNGPKQPLLVKLPSFRNARAMDDILDQMNAWFADYLGGNYHA